MILIDKLAYMSPMRRTSPFLKSTIAIGALLISVGMQSFAVAVIVLISMGYLTVYYGKVSLSAYKNMMLAPAAFLFMGTLAILFDVTSVKQDLINIPIGSMYISSSVNNLITVSRLIIVAISSVACLYFLSSTTPMTDIILVLNKLRCPAILVELMMLIYRFIFVIGDVATTITQAQESRLSNISRRRHIKAIGQMLSVLLIRAIDKSNKLYNSMEARCYDGRIRVLEEVDKSGAGQKLITGLYLMFLLIVGTASNIFFE